MFAVFFVQGASPVPDVNEPYYLGKAIHFWNPDWVRGDFFLDSADTHTVFYFTFGWLSVWLSPPVLAWFGRVVTWGLLAWAWWRLSRAVVPVRWFAVLSAALWVCFIEHCHMAGEWVVGGAEAKGFAFVLVLLGVEALVRDRWNRAWLLLGAAAAFHVLVGGWSVVAAGLGWLWLGEDRPTLRSMWPAILGGFLLSLPGLIPSLVQNWGAAGELIRQAHQIYVFDRLGHHLALDLLPAQFVRRFVILLVLWLVLCRAVPSDGSLRRLRAFVVGAIGVALAGAAITPLAYFDRAMAAGLLRFYWFRLADVALPMGVALGAASFVVWKLRVQPVLGRCWLVVVIVVASVQVGIHAAGCAVPTPPPADRLPDYVAWRLACDHVARSDDIPRRSRFLTPRMAQTFKWYAGRAEVADWKDIPQDATGIVEWWRRMNDLYATGSNLPEERWHDSLAELGPERLKHLAEKYQAEYAITASKPRLPLEVIYENRSYVIYRLQ